jgi:hypothetical protein
VLEVRLGDRSRVQKFFDEVPWDLVVKAVKAVTDARWVLLYVERWLAAPLEHPGGVLEQRTKGTPQGSAMTAPTQSRTSSLSARFVVLAGGVCREV